MNPTLPAITIGTPRLLPQTPGGWMLGRIIDASVIGRDGANSIRLRVDGVEVRAATSLPLQAGQQLSLKVTQVRPVVTLSPLPGTPAPAPEAATVRTALNRTLPLQNGLAPVFDKLEVTTTLVATRPGASPPASQLPAAVVEGARALSAMAPRPEQMTAPKLRQLLLNAGITAETNAAAHTANAAKPELPPTDMKWQLLRLRGALHEATATARNAGTAPSLNNDSTRAAGAQPAGARPATTTVGAADDGGGVRQRESLLELGRLVDGAIAKIESNQLKAVSALLEGGREFAFEIPVPVEDGYRDLRLLVTRDGETPTTDDTPAHRVIIEIPVTPHSTVLASLTLHNDTLGVRLWSADASLCDALVAHQDALTSRLNDQGIAQLNVQVGEVRAIAESGRKLHRLVDDRA